MIVAKLMGGLGNQMFQYAAALSLAGKHGSEAKVDLSFLNADPDGQYTKRDFELDVFEKQVPVVTGKELEGLLPNTKTWWQKLFQPDSKKWNFAIEQQPGFNREFQNFPDNTYLQGFWQSEKYFKGQEDRIRTAFEFSSVIRAETKNWEEKISAVNAVSMHVRRGDYVSRPEAALYHGVLNLEYYQNALDLIRKKENEAQVFIFSDDLEWCRTHLAIEGKVNYVNSANAAGEMHLMSLCRHQVIANSSFSWWGAWLNRNPAKIVVAPKQWNQKAASYSPDIYCKDWTLI